MHCFYHEHVENELITDLLWKDARAYFASKNARLVSRAEANAVNFVNLFDSLVSYHEGGLELYLALPKAPRDNIAIPYDIVDHESFMIEGTNIRYIVESFINSHFGGEIYMFSADRNCCFSVVMPEFSYDDLFEISLTNLNTPIVIFNSECTLGILFHYDLNITVVTLPFNSGVLLGGIAAEKWHEYFNEHFHEGAFGGEVHMRVVNENYVPRIRGLRPV